jgi:hypothetical protein
MVIASESPLGYCKSDYICQKKKKHVNINKQKNKQHSAIALDQNFATHM